MFTKICSYLGAAAFLVLSCLFGHIAYENSKYVPPPTLEEQFKNVVAITTTEGY